MKILHAAQSLKGGPASYFEEIIPDQIARYGEGNVALCVPHSDMEYIDQIVTGASLFTFSSRRRSLSALVDFTRIFNAAIRDFRPDLVHLHSSFAGALGRIAMPFGGVRPKIVYCAHGWAFDMRGGKSRLTGAVAAQVERLLAMRTDRIINISHADQESARRRGIGQFKSRVIQNGVADLPLPGASKAERQRALGMDPDKINLLFVGRFDTQKGVDIAFEAMELLAGQPYHLYVIGDHVVTSKGNLKLDGIAEAENISLLGWKSRNMLSPWFAAADMLVMPSRWEGFGLSAIEAMRMATPVLATRSGALPEIIIDGVNGRLVPPESSADIARILREESKVSLKCYGVAARKTFEEKFTSARLNNDLADLYSQLT